MKKIYGVLIATSIVVSSLSGALTNVVHARTYSGENGQIFYAKTEVSYPVGSSIRAINPDGSNDTQQITGTLGFNLSSSASNKIVYEQYIGVSDDSRLMVANQDGSDATQIPLPGLDFGLNSGVNSFQLSFLNDTAVVFSAADSVSGNVDIYRVNVDGTGLTKLTNATPAVENRYANPVVSPTNDRMLAESGVSIGSKNLLVMDLAGNTMVTIPTSTTMQEIDYAWSPNGKQVLVTEYFAGIVTVSVYDVSDTTATLAYTVAPSNVSTVVYDAVFSPDGQYIALMAPPAGADFDPSYLWTVPVSNPTGPAQQLVGVGMQNRGSGANSWIDWKALPIAGTPIDPGTTVPSAPNTGVARSSESLLPFIAVIIIGSTSVIVLIVRHILRRTHQGVAASSN